MKVLLNQDFEFVSGGQGATTSYETVEFNESTMDKIDDILGASMLFSVVSCVNAKGITLSSVSYGAFAGALIGIGFMGLRHIAGRMFASQPASEAQI